MSFSSVDVILVQFRQKAGEKMHPAVRQKQSAGKKSGTGIMTELLQRNGASLEHIAERLSDAGFGIKDAYVEQRSRSNGKPCQLLTFVFDKKAQVNRELEAEFKKLAGLRYEYVTAYLRQGLGRPLLAINAKTLACEAVKLQALEDDKAAYYGIVVSKAIVKRYREEPQAEEHQATVATFVPKPVSKPAPKPKSEPKPRTVLVIDDVRASLHAQFASAGMKVSLRR